MDLVGDKWTLLIVRDLVIGPRRFVELQRVLPGISTEQLRSRLNRMVADGLLIRQRYREVPPRVTYQLTERSRALAPVIAELSRWGYAWAWTPPREGEAIDIGAIFRATPELLAATGAEGTVALRVDDRTHVLRLGGGTAELVVDDGEDATATLAGSEAAWVTALSPDGDPTALEVEGDAQLAAVVLDALRSPVSNNHSTVRAA